MMALKLSRLSVPEKIEKSRFIVSSMTTNAFFIAPNPVPIPTLAVITADVNALETAYIAAKGGGKDETAMMHAKEEVLNKDLLILAAYVQMVSNNNGANAEAVALSSGMDIKHIPVHTAHEFSVSSTGRPGEIKTVTRYFNRSVFHWQMSTDGITWQTIGMTTRAKLIKGGLVSGQRYYFRVAVIDKEGQGPWSNVLNTIVL